MTHPRSPVRDF
uniref:Uncharacterized protein n=1 Tax=Anguilla anguilla TaxID=7936 RepID=A0A0E9USK8_ANGAN